MAEALDFQTLSVEKIRNTVLKVLETPKYKENMMRRSKFLQDQPEKPLNRAIWWIEYVIRNPDLNHMKSPTLELGTIGSNLLDVYALYLLVIVVGYKVIKFGFNSVFQKQSSKKAVKLD